MALQLNKWLRQIHSPMRSMTELLATLAAISLPNTSLSTHLPHIQTLYHLLAAAAISKPTCKDQLRITTQPEFTPLVTHFTSLLTALIPQLEKLGCRLSIVATSIGTLEEEVFWELWRFLVVGCFLFGSAFGRDSILTDFQPSNASFYAACDTLLKWLLSISRSPAWVAMQKQHGLGYRNGELLVILAQPLNCLVRLGTIESIPIQVSHLKSFPPTTLPLLCCIMSEQFTDVPMLVPQPHPVAWQAATTYKQRAGESYLSTNLPPFLNLMVAAINNLAILTKQQDSGVLSSLTAPAVLHFLKAVLIVAKSLHLNSQYNLLPTSLSCLEELFSLYDSDINTNPGALLSDSDARSNRDAVGLPLHLNPRLSKQVLETDVRLLHAMNQHSIADGGLLTQCYAILTLILRNWMLAGRLYPISTETLAVMVGSVVGIAKLCTSREICMLQQLQQLQQDKARQLVQHDKPCQLVQHDGGPAVQKDINLDLVAAVTASSGEKEELDVIRTLMHLTSSFNITLQLAGHDTTVHPTTGR